jgi:hypothetical protein
MSNKLTKSDVLFRSTVDIAARVAHTALRQRQTDRFWSIFTGKEATLADKIMDLLNDSGVAGKLNR